MRFDAIRIAINRAQRSFGGSDGVFTAAGLAHAISSLSETGRMMDGRVVEMILWNYPTGTWNNWNRPESL